MTTIFLMPMQKKEAGMLMEIGPEGRLEGRSEEGNKRRFAKFGQSLEVFGRISLVSRSRSGG
jgi:hypothetical protein